MAGIADLVDTLGGLPPDITGAIKPPKVLPATKATTYHPDAPVNQFNELFTQFQDEMKRQRAAMPAPFQAQPVPVMAPIAPSAPPALQTLPVPPGGTSTGEAQPGLRHTTVYDRPFTGTPKLRTVRGVSLQPGALATLIRLQKKGIPILTNIISSYRSYAQQVSVYQHNHPRGLPAATPGSSYHQQGLAIDVNSNFLAAHPEVRGLLEGLGWHSGASFNDPNHYSFGVIG